MRKDEEEHGRTRKDKKEVGLMINEKDREGNK
jgi:hypothetical protein